MFFVHDLIANRSRSFGPNASPCFVFANHFEHAVFGKSAQLKRARVFLKSQM